MELKEILICSPSSNEDTKLILNGIESIRICKTTNSYAKR